MITTIRTNLKRILMIGTLIVCCGIYVVVEHRRSYLIVFNILNGFHDIQGYFMDYICKFPICLYCCVNKTRRESYKQKERKVNMYRNIALNLTENNQRVATIIFDVADEITPLALKHYINPVVRAFLHSDDGDGICCAWNGTITYGDLLQFHIPEEYWSQFYICPRYGIISAPESIDVDINEVIINNLPTRDKAHELVATYLNKLAQEKTDILPSPHWNEYTDEIVQYCHDFYNDNELFRASALAFSGSFDNDENEPTGLPYPDDCPFGGDTMRDCADCVFADEHHFDFATGRCVLRD